MWESIINPDELRSPLFKLGCISLCKCPELSHSFPETCERKVATLHWHHETHRQWTIPMIKITSVVNICKIRTRINLLLKVLLTANIRVYVMLCSVASIFMFYKLVICSLFVLLFLVKTVWGVQRSNVECLCSLGFVL